MEIEVLTSEEQQPLNSEGLLGLGAEYDKTPLLETIVEGLPGPLEETTNEGAKLSQEPKAKPQRSARAKAVRFEAQER